MRQDIDKFIEYVLAQVGEGKPCNTGKYKIN